MTATALSPTGASWPVRAARTWLLALVLPLAGACASTPTAPPPVTAEGEFEYRLGPNDEVRITVFGHDNLSGEFQLDGAGNLSLPLIRLVEAEGLTTAELEAVIADKLQPDYLRNPRVSVDVIAYRPFFILGEVRNPGSYAFVNNMTVVTAVAQAGGYTYRAAKKKIVIIRADDPGRTRRLADESTPVYPGDVIEIPERFF